MKFGRFFISFAIAQHIIGSDQKWIRQPLVQWRLHSAAESKQSRIQQFKSSLFFSCTSIETLKVPNHRSFQWKKLVKTVKTFHACSLIRRTLFCRNMSITWRQFDVKSRLVGCVKQTYFLLLLPSLLLLRIFPS